MIERMGFEANKGFTRKFGNRPETVQIGDKECHFRSQGEKRLAQYFELLKLGQHHKDWAFEQTTFHFPTGGKYLVDFDVLNNDGTFEYYEFKGKFKQEDALKLELLFAHRPEVQLTYVFENKREAAKLARRKVSRLLKSIKIQSTSRIGLEDFDGKCPAKKKPTAVVGRKPRPWYKMNRS